MKRFALHHVLWGEAKPDPEVCFETVEQAVKYLEWMGFRTATLERKEKPGLDIIARSPNEILHQFAIEAI